jgi:hypothetical protein
MSKNQTLSQNFTRDANHHEFTVDQNSIIVANTQPYGAVAIEQVAKGVNYPNVQSAIDDMAALFILPVNTILTTSDGISPAGVSQIDQFKFTGTVRADGKTTGQKTIINFYGFYTEVTIGDTAEEAASKIKFTLEQAAQKGIAIAEVTTGVTLNILQLRYSDFKTHNLKPYSDQGITITPTTVTPAKAGYGMWTKIGTETRTLDAATGPVTFYYFRRDN